MKGKNQNHLLDIPCILLLIVFGFLIEFLIELPFIILCTIDGYISKHKFQKSFVDKP
jgi:hypothetical protein